MKILESGDFFISVLVTLPGPIVSLLESDSRQPSKMDETKVNYHKTQIDLMSFEIDLLDEQSKVEVIKHLEETLSLLKIGAKDILSPKRIKLENEANKVQNEANFLFRTWCLLF